MSRSGALAITLTLLWLAGCRQPDPEAGRAAAGDTIHNPIAERPPPPSSAVVPVQLRILTQWDEEGGVLTEAAPTPTSPGPYEENGVVYADAAVIRDLLSPGTRIETSDSVVLLDGLRTGIPVRRHGDSAYAPVKPLAARLGAYTHIDRGLILLYPVRLLCEVGRDARPGAPVFDGARAEGLLDRCPR